MILRGLAISRRIKQGVAQSGRVPALETGGRRFKSYRPDRGSNASRDVLEHWSRDRYGTVGPLFAEGSSHKESRNIEGKSQGVAQPGSAPASGAGGRRFESSLLDWESTDSLRD